MFKLKKKFLGYKVDVELTMLPIVSIGDKHFFGYPLNLDELIREEIPFEQYPNVLKGSWLCIQEKGESIKVCADLTGGFRLYQVQVNNTIYLSDDYAIILQKSSIPIRKNEWEYYYWQKHRYCTGGRTFVNRLNKLKPASVLTISSLGAKEENVFNNTPLAADYLKHISEVHFDLKESVACLPKDDQNQTVILFFSGGVDSTLLAKLLMDEGVPFKAVFLKPNPQPEANKKDFENAKVIADLLKMPLDFCVFKNDHPAIDKEDVYKLQLFDRHFASTFFYGTQAVIDKYGKDIIVVNGQSSDNVLSFGPTNGWLSYLQRYVLYQKDFKAKGAAQVLSKLKKKNFLVPRNSIEQQLAFLDEYEYCYLFDPNEDALYYNYLKQLIRDENLGHFNMNTKLMYWRLFSYLQGSDNQVVVNSAKYLGVKGIVMPYATPNIIYSTIAHKDWKREVQFPKYCIKDILKTYDFVYPEDHDVKGKISRFAKLLKYDSVFPDDEKLGMEGAISNYAEQLFKLKVKEEELA